MKTKSLLLFTLLTLTFYSCKNDTNENKDETLKENVNQFFSVELKVQSEKDDNFALYYTEDKSINFIGDKAVWSGVKGQLESQNITLNLPEEVIPTDIRIDFGIKNKDERGDVILENFKMSYYGKSFERKGSDFLKYFIKNDSIETEIDEVKGTIKFIKNQKNSINPFYYPKQEIIDEISKITTGK